MPGPFQILLYTGCLMLVLFRTVAHPAFPIRTDDRSASPGDPFVDRVVSFEPGPGSGFGKDRLPTIVLGPPRGGGLRAGSRHVLSLGQRGRITLAFVDNQVIDGPGGDLLIFENAFLTGDGGQPANGFFELAKVEVSIDGISWKPLPYDTGTRKGCAGWHPVFANSDTNRVPATDPKRAGGDLFDLRDVGLRYARYVRITDLDNALGGSGTVGFDLDAVAAVHSQPRSKSAP